MKKITEAAEHVASALMKAGLSFFWWRDDDGAPHWRLEFVKGPPVHIWMSGTSKVAVVTVVPRPKGIDRARIEAVEAAGGVEVAMVKSDVVVSREIDAVDIRAAKLKRAVLDVESHALRLLKLRPRADVR